jgi:chromosome partitioning protein
MLEAMTVISVLAQKGGVGKTTLTLHWAVAAEATAARRVAVIDSDPQGSAASWARRRQKETPAVFQVTESTDLAAAVEACPGEGFDLVLVDTMPRVERPSVEAARLADLVVIPCGPTILDVEAIAATIAIVQRVDRPAVIVLNQGRPGSTVNGQAVELLAGYGLPVCPAQIMRRASLADAFNDGRAVMEIEPGGKGAAEITASWSWIEQHLRRS